MWWQKRRAQNNELRAAEATFLLIEFFGENVSFLAGTYRFCYRTRKRSFQGPSLVILRGSTIV
jgi:uncharacterized membrane protein YsdA (DUF1294 family)